MSVTEYEFTLPLRTEKELRLFVNKAFGIRIPNKTVCAGHVSPWRAFADAYFAKSEVSVWKASRGFGGKSHLLALLGLVEAATLKADVNILGGSGLQASRVLEYMGEMWQHPNAPRSLLRSDPLMHETRLKWGNRIQALLASQRSVRGPHPQRLRLDEVDEMDLKIFDASMGQTLRKDEIASQTVASSTHQYPNGTMSEVLRRAKTKGWPVYEWCYHETHAPHGWLTDEDIAAKRGQVTDLMWLTEYDLQEPAGGSRAITTDKVLAMFLKTLGEFEGENGELIEIEPPVAGAKYVHGADWARKVDWTIIVTLRIDVFPYRLVSFQRMGRMAWPTMVGALDTRVKRYGGLAFFDGTGIGDVVGGYLTVPAVGVQMVGKARSEMLTGYITGVERGMIAAPFIRWMLGEHQFASVQDVYGSANDLTGGDEKAHLPDTIAAMALAFIGAPKEYVGNASNWLKAYEDDEKPDEPQEQPQEQGVKSWVDAYNDDVPEYEQLGPVDPNNPPRRLGI